MVDKYKEDSFLGSGYKNFDLKYIFDYLRNMGLVSILCYVGLKLLEYPLSKPTPNLIINREIVGVSIVVLSVLLLVINYLQFVYVASSKNTIFSKTIAVFVSVPTYFVTVSFYYVYVHSLYNS